MTHGSEILYFDDRLAYLSSNVSRIADEKKVAIKLKRGLRSSLKSLDSQFYTFKEKWVDDSDIFNMETKFKRLESEIVHLEKIIADCETFCLPIDIEIPEEHPCRMPYETCHLCGNF